MAHKQHKYDQEYKVQAVKLARESGGEELGIPEGTIHTWLKAARIGTLNIGEGSRTPQSAMSLAEEPWIMLCWLIRISEERLSTVIAEPSTPVNNTEKLSLNMAYSRA